MKLVGKAVAEFSLTWICSFVYLYGVYSPVASISYAHHDEYRYFLVEDHSRRRSDGEWDWLNVIGRPVAAELEHQIFKRVHVIEDLSPIRAFGIGLVATAMTLLIFCLTGSGLTPLPAFCIAGAINVLPPVQYCVFMATYNHAVAYILALLSAMMMRRGSRPAASRRTAIQYVHWVTCYGGAIGLLVLAQMSYPPRALVVLLPICAEIVLKGSSRWARCRRHFLRDTCVVAASCVAYFAIIKANYHYRGGHTVSAYKIQLNRDLFGRLKILVVHVGTGIMNFWNVVYPSRALALAACCFLISGAGLMLVRLLVKSHRGPKCLRRFRHALQMVGALALLLVFSEITFLAAPTDLNLARMHFASAAIGVLLMVGAVVSWGRLISQPWRRRISFTMAVALLCGSGMLAQWTVLMNCLNSNMELCFVSARLRLTAPVRFGAFTSSRRRTLRSLTTGCPRYPAMSSMCRPHVLTRTYIGWCAPPCSAFLRDIPSRFSRFRTPRKESPRSTISRPLRLRSRSPARRSSARRTPWLST